MASFPVSELGVDLSTFNNLVTVALPLGIENVDIIDMVNNATRQRIMNISLSKIKNLIIVQNNDNYNRGHKTNYLYKVFNTLLCKIILTRQ